MVFRVAHYPSLGKEQELRRVLQEKEVANFRSRGLSVNFMTRILFEDGPEFATYVSINDMESFEKFRETNATDPAWREMVSQTSQLSRRSPSLGFFVSMLDGANRGIDENAKYFFRVTMRPSPGSEAELSGLLVHFANQRIAEGHASTRLTRQILPASGPAYIIVTTYGSLAEYDNDLVKQRPASVVEVLFKLGGLLQSPHEQAMYEIISID